MSLYKSTSFSRMSVTASQLCFGCFADGEHVDKWVLFPSINVYFYWLAQIIEIYKRLACIVKTATGVQCLVSIQQKRLCLRVFSFPIAFQNDWHRRHTSNTSSYSILSRGKQLFYFFVITNKVSIPFQSNIHQTTTSTDVVEMG